MVASETCGGVRARLGSRNRGVASQPPEMLQCLPLEGEEGTESEKKENSSLEDRKEIVTLAFVNTENSETQEGLQNAQQQGKKKRKKKSA